MIAPLTACPDRVPLTKRLLDTLKRAQRPVTVSELVPVYRDTDPARIRSALFLLRQTRRVRRVGAGRQAPYVWVTDEGIIAPPPTMPRPSPQPTAHSGLSALQPRWPRPRGTSLGPPLLGLACR